MVFTYTGFRPSQEFKSKILSNGGKFEDKIKNNVTHLIVKKKTNKKTNKIKSAEQKGIAIVYLDDF